MRKKIIAFDQDDTLNITKLPVDDEMADLLADLLKKYDVCIISGTNWGVMGKNDVKMIAPRADENQLKRLHIMPTTGTQYWHYVGADYDEKQLTDGQKLDDGWKREYADFLNDEQVAKITASLETAAKKLGFWEVDKLKDGDEIIENRGSQITFSALGQWAKPDDKYKWDPDQTKRKAIVAEITPELADLGVKIAIGGTTSVDITLPGIDKAYGMRQLEKMTGFRDEDILFIGDKLQPGGNDYPARAMGLDWIEVKSVNDTKWVIRGILGVS
jgi:hydroxymethylpyrimidine pyrophosphatase-like HAD family hydrolase